MAYQIEYTTRFKKEYKLAKKRGRDINLLRAVIEILAKSGQQVKEGDTLIVLEAMKMNNNLTAEKDGVVKSILVAEGEAVKENTPLVTFE